MKTVKNRVFLLIAVVAMVSTIAKGQSAGFDIKYTESAELFVGEIQLNGNVGIKKIIKNLGEPGKTKQYADDETGYYYEKEGIVFFTQKGLVKGLGINFNWDGDEKFPEETFAGTLMLAESKIGQNTKREEIAAIEGIEFVCPFPALCASKDRTAEVKCTVAFKDEELTQVVFIIKPD